jgi:hypothetical protein
MNLWQQIKLTWRLWRLTAPVRTELLGKLRLSSEQTDFWYRQALEANDRFRQSISRGDIPAARLAIHQFDSAARRHEKERRLFEELRKHLT